MGTGPEKQGTRLLLLFLALIDAPLRSGRWGSRRRQTPEFGLCKISAFILGFYFCCCFRPSLPTVYLNCSWTYIEPVHCRKFAQ